MDRMASWMHDERIEDTVVVDGAVENVHGEEVQEDDRIEDTVVMDAAVWNVDGVESPLRVPSSSSGGSEEEDDRIDDDRDVNVSDE